VSQYGSPVAAKFRPTGIESFSMSQIERVSLCGRPQDVAHLCLDCMSFAFVARKRVLSQDLN
jgi:hypothetical protein